MSDIIINSASLNTISDVYNTPLQQKSDTSGEAFTSFFDASMNMINETSSLQTEAKQLQLDFASGESDDILAVTLAQEKAMTALNFTVQVTNKLVDAYKEIMQIQL